MDVIPMERVVSSTECSSLSFCPMGVEKSYVLGRYQAGPKPILHIREIFVLVPSNAKQWQEKQLPFSVDAEEETSFRTA